MLISALAQAGASLAIDDRYEVWESGYISIPFDFQLQDLQPRLKRLLATSSTSSPSVKGGVLEHEDVSFSERSDELLFANESPSEEPFASKYRTTQRERGVGVSAIPQSPVHFTQPCRGFHNRKHKVLLLASSYHGSSCLPALACPIKPLLARQKYLRLQRTPGLL